MKELPPADSSSKDGALMYLLLSTKGRTQIIGQVKICGGEFQELGGVNHEAGIFFFS